MPDNCGRMTSDEAPQQEQKEESIYKHTPGPWTIYNHAGTDSGHYDGYLKRNVRLMAAAPSMHDALWAIANMQVQEETDKGEVLALCKSIALLELEKCSTSEWLRGLETTAKARVYKALETTAKARVYKAAVDQLADSMAAGAWQDGPAPKDGSWILGLFHGLPYVVRYDSWEVGGEMLPDGSGSPPDGHESGWCLAGDNIQVMDQDEPEKWARIIHPDRHMPASWDGPGD